MAKQVSSEDYVITTPAEAEKCLAVAVELKESIAEEIQEIEDRKRAVADYMAENDIKQIPLNELGKHGTLVQRSSTEWDRLELLRLVKKAKPKGWKDVWQKMTTRQPDRDKIQEAIKAGVVKSDQISDALVEKAHRPYVQVFDGD